MARPRSDIRPRILDSARARFLTEGVDGASLRRIASDAGTNIGMIYYYFPTKDDLFLAVLEDVYAKVLADLEVALAPDAPVEKRIERLYVRIAAFDEREVTTLRIIAREALGSSARLDSIIDRFSRGHLPLLLRLVADGVSAGTLTDRLPLPVLFGALGGVGLFPQVMRRIVGERAVNPFAQLPTGESLAPILVDALLNGVGGPHKP